jgi:hypothetical protein
MHVFVRHCLVSVSDSKARPEGFDRKALFQKVLETIGDAKLTVILDRKSDQRHWIEELGLDVRVKYCGSDSASFNFMLDVLVDTSPNWTDDEILVFLEDDYDIKDDWTDLICEGFAFGDYATLYDHPDKYSAMYAGISSRVFCGTKSHWRTTPSTTNSYAVKWGTLKKDLDIHRTRSKHFHVNEDHAKFLDIWARGRSLVSCIPGRWSHMETGVESKLF